MNDQAQFLGCFQDILFSRLRRVPSNLPSSSIRPLPNPVLPFAYPVFLPWILSRTFYRLGLSRHLGFAIRLRLSWAKGFKLYITLLPSLSAFNHSWGNFTSTLYKHCDYTPSNKSPRLDFDSNAAAAICTSYVNDWFSGLMAHPAQHV